MAILSCGGPPVDGGAGGGSGGHRAGGAGGSAGSGGGHAGGTATGGGGTGGSASGGSGGANGGGSAGGFAAPDAGFSSCLGVLDNPARACNSLDTPGGLCRSQSCVPCSPATDDALCAVAYGGNTAAAWLCDQGTCAPGTCRTAANCTGAHAGAICLSAVHQCAPCSSDLQCQHETGANYGPSTICNVGTGRCVPASCTTAGAACSLQNPSDFCCGSACVPGTCCTNADCSSGTCINHTCTTCTAATGGTYCVDPAGGSDLTATGSGIGPGGASATCCFKTLTRAIAFLGAAPAASTLVLRGDDSTASGETFPVRLPANVSVRSQTPSAPVSVRPPGGAFAFELAGANSSLTDLILDGQSVGAGGVRVLAGTGFLGNVLSHCTIRNMALDGVRVEGGGVELDSHVDGNGRNGVNVTAGTARIVPGLTGAASFDDNAMHGIFVNQAGAVIVGGLPGPDAGVSGAGSVTANRNAGSGLHLLNPASTVMPFNRIEGLVAVGNRVDGIRVGSNSNITSIKNNVLLGNSRAGFSIRAFFGLPVGVLLNGDTQPNTLQAPAGQNPNLGGGLCIDNFAGTTISVDARNNRFGTADCSVSSSSPALTRALTCTGGVDVGGVAVIDGGSPANVHVNLSNCQNI